MCLSVEQADLTHVPVVVNCACSVFDRSVLVSNGKIHDELLTYTQPKTAALLKKGIDLSPWFVPKGYKMHHGQP
jgi:myo-inositol-1(or 4)-monophosphatase